MNDEEVSLEFQLFSLAFKVPGAIDYFEGNLLPEILEKVGLQQFYAALIDFYRKTGIDPVDPIAFKAWLSSETDIYEALGGVAHVSLFIETLVGIEELPKPESAVSILKHRSNKRTQLNHLQELQLIFGRKEIKTEEDQSRISFLTERIRALEGDMGLDPLSFVLTANDIAKDADQLWDLPDFIATPYRNLNIAIGYSENSGVVRGGVYSIIALSGAGKTTLARNLVNYWADSGYTILFVNYEEPRAHWERTLLTQIIKRNVYRGATSDEKEYLTKEFKEKMEEWGDRFMVRHDPDTPYFEDLELWLRDIQGHNSRIPDIIVIDTIQSMFIKGSGGRPRWNQFEEMMVRLEKLAKDLNCVIIITAQENSNRLKEGREVVNMGDIGGSLTIAQKSTVTIFITEKRLAGDDSEDERIMQLQIPKNRITGTTYMSNPPLVRYDDESKSYYEYEIPTESSYSAIDFRQIET